MPEERKKRNSQGKVPDHVFIDQGPRSFHQDRSRLVSSQARRFQSAGKRQNQRFSARQDAGYARSLVGWRSTSSTPSADGRKGASALSLKSKSPDQRQREEGSQQEQPRGVHVSLSIRTGLRTDPFSAFPSSNTKTVMLQVDYYIHVWAPHKAGNFDDLMGYNTHLDLCWPVALQDDMLFDATVAVSRTAWVLAQGKDPAEDQFMLYHRGLAMSSLRQKLSSASFRCTEAVLFTIGRMVSIAYMSSEPEAFIAHFDAFQKIAQEYIAKHPESDVARVIENRLQSWDALHGYRTAQGLTCKSSPRLPSRSRSQSKENTPPKQQLRAQSPTLLGGLDLPVGMAEELKFLTRSLTRSSSRTAGTSRTMAKSAPELVEHCRRFSDKLRSCDELTPTDLQLCCSLLAFCLQLHRHLVSRMEEAGAVRDVFDVSGGVLLLDDLAKTFINQKLDGFSDSQEQKMTLTWSALVLGSFLLQQADNRLRTKGHIVHVNLGLRLGLGRAGSSPDCESDGWALIESLLSGPDRMGSLWHSELTSLWRRDWQGSMKRQKRWGKQGVWMIGAPKRLPSHAGRSLQGSMAKNRRPEDTRRPGSPSSLDRSGDVDIIEYLVLREARNSLPLVD
ncbi:hypothetical protein PV04_08037 [Phialophora macrospora]|uniref:Transcription factor domain-containing protein n=1 Tax=Phialophora macrospora TaxID=1851006 RepID=A0A0D2FG95_9EURO|nr:hypothetical protein PV04_08037 [Phialophora macrospora]